MDDSADVIDLSFVIDSEDELDESGENSNNNPSQGDQTGPSTGAGPSNQPILPIAGLQLSPSDEHDFESLDRVVLRTNLGSSQGDVPEPKPRNVETERRDIRKIWSSSVIAVDTAEMNKAAAQAKKEEELRIRHEHDLQNSRMAYDMLKNEMTKLQWKYERERARKIRSSRAFVLAAEEFVLLKGS
ncbi:hypothetical protein BGX31_004082 [Mortierella sp. GBA43]|nr:hypothetical protein BGX31_004082 [Mortierella sp. GBA43]